MPRRYWPRTRCLIRKDPSAVRAIPAAHWRPLGVSVPTVRRRGHSHHRLPRRTSKWMELKDLTAATLTAPAINNQVIVAVPRSSPASAGASMTWQATNGQT